MTSDDLTPNEGETEEERLRRLVEEMAAQSSVYRGNHREHPAKAIPPAAPSPSPRRARPAKARPASGPRHYVRKNPVDTSFLRLGRHIKLAEEAARQRRPAVMKKEIVYAEAAKAMILAATPALQLRKVQRRLRPYMRRLALAQQIARGWRRASRGPAL
jgi:hypothetical protein